MSNKKSTKRALLTSVLAMLLCLAMLVGTTFAWFTDSVTSANNKIQSGTLNIDLLVKDADGNYQSVKDTQEAIFDYDKWEPGYTEVRNVKVTTTGNLALKYTLRIVPQSATEDALKLAEVIDVYYANSDVTVENRDLSGLTKIGTLKDILEGVAGTVINDTLIPGENTEDFATIALKMQESAGNDYQDLSVGNGFDLNVLATQYTYEEDSFDDQYDANALYPAIPANISFSYTKKMTKGTSISLTGDPSGISVSSPSNTVVAGDTWTLTVETIEVAGDSVTYDINFEVVDENGDPKALTNPVTVKIPIGAGLNNVQVTHNGTPMTESSASNVDQTYSYNSGSGVLSICTKTFSPFEVTYSTELVATLNGVGYSSVRSAVDAAKDGDTITLLKDDVKTEAFVYCYKSAETRNITLDLAGNTLECTNSYAVFLGQTGTSLTIKNGTIKGLYGVSLSIYYNQITLQDVTIISTKDSIVSNGGAPEIVLNNVTIDGTNNTTAGRAVYAEKAGTTITINSGTYIGAAGASCVYAGDGDVVINGGFFEVEGPYNDKYYVLNLYDSGSGTITVYGGTFVNFDPSNSETENPAVSFVADGYTVVAEEQENGDIWYTVVPEE